MKHDFLTCTDEHMQKREHFGVGHPTTRVPFPPRRVARYTKHRLAHTYACNTFPYVGIGAPNQRGCVINTTSTLAIRKHWILLERSLFAVNTLRAIHGMDDVVQALSKKKFSTKSSLSHFCEVKTDKPERTLVDRIHERFNRMLEDS